MSKQIIFLFCCLCFLKTSVALAGNVTSTAVVADTSTVIPTKQPVATPAVVSTVEPTVTPTAEPTVTPTAEPTATPTVEPTATPTAEPTVIPTAEPTVVSGSAIVTEIMIKQLEILTKWDMILQLILAFTVAYFICKFAYYLLIQFVKF